MNFRLLGILGWICFYLLMIETGLEVRAYYRGFDTILFGNFRQHDSATIVPALASDIRVTSPTSLQGGELVVETPRLWIASSSHAEDSYLSADIIFPNILSSLLRKSGVPMSVINASRAGMEIEDNRLELETRGPTVKPNFVILYQMSSSITGLSKRLLSGANRKTSRREEKEADHRKKRSHWTGPLGSWSIARCSRN